MKITTVGIDLAKNVFSVHGIDDHGKAVLRRTVSRGKVMEVMASLSPCLIGVEACSVLIILRDREDKKRQRLRDLK